MAFKATQGGLVEYCKGESLRLLHGRAQWDNLCRSNMVRPVRSPTQWAELVGTAEVGHLSGCTKEHGNKNAANHAFDDSSGTAGNRKSYQLSRHRGPHGDNLPGGRVETHG